MAIWEYKVISSGKGGFATPTLLENFVNQLGKDEWEIISFHTAPDNPLAFHGLARRGMQREWNLEAAAAAKAKADEQQRLADERAAREAEIRREERGEDPTEKITKPTDAGASPEDAPLRDQKIRTIRDTENDDDPDALAAEAAGETVGDWDEWPEEDELPTLFDAIKPHVRRNQRGPGQAVAIDYLAKRWNQLDEDIVGALEECGFTLPANEDDAPEYFEFEGDLYWLNRNNRGQLFLNVREKPRPKFKPATMRKVDADDPVAADVAAEHQEERDRENDRKAKQAAQDAERKAKQAAQEEERRAKREAEREARAAKQAARAEGSAEQPVNSAPAESVPEVPATLPEGEALMELLRSRMRRNRRGPGLSGSTAFLSKALKQSEDAIVASLVGAGLTVPEDGNAKTEPVAIGDGLYWINKDSRGGIWINGREKPRDGDAEDSAEEGSSEASESPPAPDAESTDASAEPARVEATSSATETSPEPEPASADTGEAETPAKAPAKKKTARKSASRSRGRGKKSADSGDASTGSNDSSDTPETP